MCVICYSYLAVIIFGMREILNKRPYAHEKAIQDQKLDIQHHHDRHSVNGKIGRRMRLYAVSLLIGLADVC